MTTYLIDSLFCLEHGRSIRPSTSLSLYLALSIFLDTAQVVTLWLLYTDNTIAALFTASLVTRVVLLALESTEKRSMLQKPYCILPPESTGEVFNRSPYWWLNDLFPKGYQKITKSTDLYKTDKDLSSERLQQRAKICWWSRADQDFYPLAMTAVTCSILPMLLVVLPRLCPIGFRLSQPLPINRVVALLDSPSSTDGVNIGRTLTGATAIIYAGQAISTALCAHIVYRAITMVRGCLIGLIYDTTLKLPIESTTIFDSAAVIIASTEIDRIAAGVEQADAIYERLRLK